MRLGVFSIAPSPYQRALFRALALIPDCQLSVMYWEAHTPDTPWTVDDWEPWEEVLPGHWYGTPARRMHVSTSLPDPAAFDAVLFNGYVNPSIQRFLVKVPGQVRAVFMGEAFAEPPSLFARIIQALSRGFFRRIDGFVAIGKRAEAQYQKRFAPKIVINIPYAIDTQPFVAAANSKRNDSGYTLLFCGQMIERKGVDLLLQAFTHLVERPDFPDDVRIRLVGSPNQVETWLNTMPKFARERVELAGFTEPERLPSVFAQADALVLPSRYDGWGVVINQALAAGLPVITTDRVGASDVVAEADGLVIPAGDRAALEAAIAQIVRERSIWSAGKTERQARAVALDSTQAAGRLFSFCTGHE